MIAQQKHFSFENFLIKWASCWEPNTRTFVGRPVGKQPHERGWKSKCVAFILWLSEVYSEEELYEPAVRVWLKEMRPSAGWISWLCLVERLLSREVDRAA